MNRIKQLRIERGLTQKDLGDRIGKSNHAVQKWESEINVIPTDELEKICDVLGASSDYLLCRTDENNRRIDLRGEQIPKALRDAGLEYVQLLREYVDEQGGIRPDVRRELLRLMAEAEDLPDSGDQNSRRGKSQKRK